MTHLQRIVLTLLAVGATACTAVDSLGEVSLPLSATTPDGTVYQLRDGAFQITGAGGLTLGLSTEDDPGATVLHADLAADFYDAQLLAGWRMERDVDGLGFAPIAAQLVSANPQGFLVADGSITQVSFIFRVDGVGDVELGGGVDIGIDVYESCDPFAQLGCAAGERCTRVGLGDAGSTTATTCVPDGTVPEGGPCVTPAVGADDCVAGTVCNEGACVAICEAATSSCSCGVGVFPGDPDAGVCLPVCDPLAQDCADPADACYPAGASGTCATPTADAGTPGDPCMFLNDCVAGSVCTGLGGDVPGEPGCSLMCSISGAGPTCPGGFICLDGGVDALPDLGLCVDCAVYPTYCAP